jgi:hypothetical protein
MFGGIAPPQKEMSNALPIQPMHFVVYGLSLINLTKNEYFMA